MRNRNQHEDDESYHEKHPQQQSPAEEKTIRHHANDDGIQRKWNVDEMGVLRWFEKN